MRRYQGVWHLERKLIFPTNVLLESENEEALIKELEQCKNLAGQTHPIQKMDLEEETFLRFLCGKERHIEMSRGVVCKGVTQVVEGPLKGMEKRICKIDRHKRLARLRTKNSQNLRYISVGLEIVGKNE